MKNIKHFLIFVILLFQYTTSNADVLEIGGGLTESYNGEFPLWSDSSVKMKSLGMPITISLMFNNLRITGDWIKTGVNAGCVEAAVMAGMQTSRSLCGYPKIISGEYAFEKTDKSIK